MLPSGSIVQNNQKLTVLHPEFFYAVGNPFDQRVFLIALEEVFPLYVA